jgi:hypothetical protein
MEEILELLEKWATATRFAKSSETLPNRASDVTTFDALAPVNYEGNGSRRHPFERGKELTSFCCLRPLDTA